MDANRVSTTVPAVDRAVDLLRALAAARQPLMLSELSELTAASRSTVYNTLAALHEHGFVEKDDRYKTYRLGVAIFELGNAYLQQVNFVPVFYAEAQRLVDLCGETVKLVVLDGTDVVYVAKLEGSHSVRLVAQVGMRMPAHLTAVGKVLLSQSSDSELRVLYRKYSFPDHTPNAIRAIDSLLVQLANVRTNGVAYDDEESAVGVKCVAAPVFDHSGQAIAAMSIGVPVDRLDGGRIADLAALIVEYAARISHLLGWSEPTIVQP